MVDIRMWKKKMWHGPPKYGDVIEGKTVITHGIRRSHFFRQPHILEYLGCFIWEYHLDRL